MVERIFNRDPLFLRDNIPFFSHPCEYIENYEKIAQDQLESIQKTGNNPWIPEELWNELENSTADLVSKYSTKGERILDIGVGLGRLLSRFPELQRYGMDISMDLLKESRGKGIEVCYSLIEDIPYSENTFDLIVCTDVIEHVLDLKMCCEKILSCLKPGGFLIIRTPYNENLESYTDPESPYKYVHVRTFDSASIQLLFSKIVRGCRVIEYEFSGYHPMNEKCRYNLPIPLFRNCIRKAVIVIKKVHNPTYQYLVRKLFWPIEINTVIQKNKP